MILYIFITILLSIVFLYIYFYILWIYHPDKLVNLKYNVISEIKFKDIDKKGNVFIVQHDDNAVPDVVFMFNQLKNSKNKYSFISDSGMNAFFESNISPVKHNILSLKKGNIVKKSIELLNKGENLIIFFRKHFKGTGLFNILKETKSDIIIVKKYKLEETKIQNILNNKYIDLIFSKKNYNFEYKILGKNYNLDQTSDEFIKSIKNEIYSKIEN